jgi:hypothetical protein
VNHKVVDRQSNDAGNLALFVTHSKHYRDFDRDSASILEIASE